LNNIWGSDWVFTDFNNDQKLDIFWVKQNFKNDKLLFNDITNLGIENKFKDVTKTSGLENPTSCIGTVSGDFDNDMDMDIYSVCSFLELNSKGNVNTFKNIPNMLYENLGNGTFVLVSDAGGAVGSELGLGETVSMVDFDNDGFLDLYVTNGWRGDLTNSTGPSQLFRNLGNENNWLEIDLVGTISNRDGIGSHLIISSGNVTQIREQNGGMHFRAQNHQRIHVGLDSNEVVDYVIVYWPSNIVSAKKNISANQIVKITEPSKSISPNSQLDLGIAPLKVICNEDLNLIFKNKTKVACVKFLTATSLINRGWYQDFN